MLTIKTYLSISTIHGIGLFAAQDIKKNSLIWVYDGIIDSCLILEQIKKLSFACQKQVLRYSYFNDTKNEYIVCGDDARFFNHSSTPNCSDVAYTASDFGELLSIQENIWIETAKNQKPELKITIANQDIIKGQELTCDYGSFDDYKKHTYIDNG